MKLTADIAGEKYELNVRREGTRLVADIDGRALEMDVQENGEGGYLFIVDGRVYDCRVSPSAAQPEATEVHVHGSSYSVMLKDPKRLRGAQALAAHGDASAQIVAPMPGKVVRVLVETGAEVEAGAGIVVVEAMKMQNEMKSPKAGRVTTLNAKIGATVNAGEVLAIIE